MTPTGSSLAIDAPTIASGTATPNNHTDNAQGFLRQWNEVAKERKLSRLYIDEPSAEAVAAQVPNLTLASATGRDSVLTLYDQLLTIAPTLIINYGNKSWQSLLVQLGEITGQEQQAVTRVTKFGKQLQVAKQHTTLPPQPVGVLAYTVAAHSASLWAPESARGKLMEQSGFTLATLPASLHVNQSQGKRHDTIQLSDENLITGLSGETLFLFAGDSRDAGVIYADPSLTHLPAVQDKRAYALGTETSRLDYYNATLLLQRLSALF